ncbi:hypothetical protein [Micromonospora coriariae]|uniref:hypothetical protein n=1 Tax=Micromonospora coriariae TaxID=285665 RepID=UPI000B5AE79D|nr:hypothetical protein [Micromonospora coriariae]
MGAGLAADGGPPDVVRAAGNSPWPALPDDPVWPGHRSGGAASTGGADVVSGGVWTDGSGRGPVGGGWSAVTGDLWPALPDDRLLWTAPGAALDAADLSRLEREQAGD